MKQEISGILLAAGQSERFGGNKLLYALTDGTPLGLASAGNLLAVLPGSCAVVAEEDSDIADLLAREGMQIVLNPDAKQGMGTSIAAGVRANLQASVWLIALADMPYIDPDTLQQLLSVLDKDDDIVAPFYKNRRGHPVVFGRCYASELMQLNCDEGARKIIHRHQDKLKKVNVQDPHVLFDVDYRNDIEDSHSCYI